ncbi:MAG: hypothetical protein WBN07_00830 [Woeseiaceae bacterium]
MERQILAELVQIKWSLVAIFLAIALIILYYLIAIAFRIKRGNTESLVLLRETYIAELSLLESKGEYEQLLTKSEEMVNLFPADLIANWYYALGNYKNRQLGAALSALGKVKQINAAWSADSVDALMEEIRSEMDGPKSHGA